MQRGSGKVEPHQQARGFDFESCQASFCDVQGPRSARKTLLLQRIVTVAVSGPAAACS